MINESFGDLKMDKPHPPDKIIRFTAIEKSEQDSREYRGLHLENKMKVLLVSDPDVDLSAAALSVEIGNMSDPKEIPGLAHFCEHMLFLGTEKYPNENSYSSYLCQNGGTSNAATYSTMTKYYFNIAPDKLEGALDRFSQFFIAPLFTESATNREINAVHSEHELKTGDDTWRIRQVAKHLANPDHPFSKFGTGNKYSLEECPKKMNKNVREELINFHKKWYSSNIMSLAVIGRESLNELEDMVLSKFSIIENKNVTLPVWDPKPYDDENYSQKVFIAPTKEIRSLTLTFTTKDLYPYYKSSPENYISHLIGHEGSGSVYGLLREKGWCNELIVGHSNTVRGFGFFHITVKLTNEGLDHIDDTIEIIFQYLKMLREVGPQKWIFDENCQLNEMMFKFKNKVSPVKLVSNAVHAMQVYPLNDVLIAQHISNEWKPELISEVLNVLIPENCRITIVAQNMDDKLTDEEPWYNTKYGTVPIPLELINNWKNCEINKDMKLPKPNLLIPTNFDILPLDDELPKHPVIILDSPVMRVWHKQDTDFFKPKCFYNFYFSNPMAYSDPLNCNLAHLMVTLFKDFLNEYLYDASLASLKMEACNASCGIILLISGYSHKINILLEKVITDLFDLKIDRQRFDIYKEEYIRVLKNVKADLPYKQALYYLALLLTEKAWSSGELLDAVELVTYERLQQFIKEFFSRLHTECFIYGNANHEKAMEVANFILKKIENTNSVVLPLLARQMLQKREYKLNDGDTHLFEVNNDFHKSSCLQYYLQCGIQTDKSRVYAHLCTQLLNEPCYNTLRVKEQLGYIVTFQERIVNSSTGVRIIVQSSRHPSYLEERVEAFLKVMCDELESMPEEEFEKHKEALIMLKLEKPKKISSQFTRYNSEISIAQYHFERDESEVAILRNVTKDDFIAYYKKYISPESEDRHILAVYIVSNHPDADINIRDPVEETATSPPSVESNLKAEKLLQRKITDLSLFKSSKELFPITRPYLDIKAKGARSKL